MNIIDAIHDENLFRPFLGDELKSWRRWFVFLRALYGLPIPKKYMRMTLWQCTHRYADDLPSSGFTDALALTGRRSGKSRIAALIAAYETALAGRQQRLAKGERGIVACISPTRYQSRIVRDYVRAIFDVPLFANEVVRETKDGFELRNNTRIEILAGDWKTIRGYTLLAAIVDEVCFFQYAEEPRVRSDTELIRALKPALITCGGKLVCISSPYARKGWAYHTWKRDFGNKNGSVLVWNAPSQKMNPLLPQEVVDQALAEDLAAAKSEYLGEWRDDIAAYIPREVVEKLVVKDRVELLPQAGTRYSAFVDMSGGRSDASALAIAHREGQKIIVDLARQWKAPHNPNQVIAVMCDILKRYGIKRVVGDNYAAEYTATGFEGQGIRYKRCVTPASGLYIELLPRLCSGVIELPDNEYLVSQIANLERRTRSGGKDLITHGPGGHDDLANAVAGVIETAFTKKRLVGAL